MCTGHFFLAGALYMEYRALQDALKSERRLRFSVVLIFWDNRGGFSNKRRKRLLQLFNIRITGAQHGHRRCIVQQSQQQMLYAHQLMALRPGIFEYQI